MLNRVMGATPADIEDGSLADAIALLFGAGCVCQVGVHDEPEAGRGVRAWLEARGFEEGYAWMKFVHEGDAPPPADVPPAGVRVRPCEEGHGERFGATFAAGYGLQAMFAPIAGAVVGRQGWHCYLAEAGNGEAIGVGAMFVDGDTAWLGLGATVPAARRMGAQGALIRARVEAAQALGCTLIVTETGERVPDRPSASYRNLLRAGFVEHGLRYHLVGVPPG
jgi:GNAT superfamily N-acetyltransferase